MPRGQHVAPEPWPLRIGVCGVGSIGSRHTRLLSGMEGVQLYLCDVFAEHLQTVGGLPAVQAVTESYDQLLDWELDGIVIATPEQWHVEQGLAAASRRLPLLIEKPVAESAADARRLSACLQAHDVPALTGFVLRHTAIMRLARELLDQQLIGTPVSFHITIGSYDTLMLSRMRYTAAEPDRLFLDFSHEWDLINWLLGPVRRVVGASHQSGDLERTQNPNVADCLLELESTATGTVHLDYVQFPSRREVSIIGDRAVMRIDVSAGRLELMEHDAPYHRSYHRAEPRDDAFIRQLRQFLAVIRGEEPPEVTVQDGLRAAEVADAVLASKRNGTWQVVSAK